ncbi:MAG: rubrerythrin [Nitrospinae bacterium]|nr:rubrerythrin [Nitrospinota bacterium]
MPDKKKVNDLKAKIEALVIAIPKELSAYEFYVDLAAKYEDTASKEMFIFLAKQELAHRDALERLLADLQTKLEKELIG